MTTVYFVRHGETDANAEGILQGDGDFPLNAAGLAQADAVASRLASWSFDGILSSDLVRARVTAEKIARGRSVAYTPILREWRFGDWQGRRIADLKDGSPAEFQLFAAGSPLFAPPGGESARAFRLRAEKVMEELARKHAGKTVLCVSHGGLLKQILKNVLCAQDCSPLPVCGNASLSCFRTAGDRWQLVFWNDCSHLACPPSAESASPAEEEKSFAV
ncbi:MAG: histidine phosphatase family protein [Lentisphaeria bacterium]|nr:histidine phosphatase family protein [Lentisphaeria bacterium]